MSEKRVKLNQIVKNQLPSYVQEDFPLVGEFLSQYYQGQEYQGGPVDLIQNIDSYVKLSECGNLVKSTNTTAYAGITTSTIFVSNTTGFPDNYGLIKINDEIITYESKTDISFVNCKRGFSGITSFRNPSDPENLVFSTSTAQNHENDTVVENLSVLFLDEFLKKAKNQFLYGFQCGLNEKVNIEIKDYRDLKNKYNSIASIEMIEAVGQNYLESYFKTIKDNLSDDGRAAIQAITIDDNMFDRYKNKTDFIQKYIFPGGFLPSKNIINKCVSENGLAIKSYDSYADHYSDTLAIWRNEFNKKWDLIKKQGFDLTFKRMWEFYLSYCEAGFKSKNIDLIQFSLQNKWSLKETND